MSASRLAPNWAFVLNAATSLAPSGRILDYGCGQGEVVAAGVERGLDIYGAEVFYGGGHGQREAVARRGLLERRVFHIIEGETPFEDNTFDFVFHNQVFEHVPDLDEALQEIRRVLKPEGMMLSLFPSRDVLREGHCGVPLAHWFRKGSRLRYLWLLSARRCGLGTFHGDKSPEQWARDFGGSKIGVIIAREKISCTRTADQDSPLIATRRRTPPLAGVYWVEMGSPWIRGIGSYDALGNQKARRDGRVFQSQQTKQAGMIVRSTNGCNIEGKRKPVFNTG
jgi:SAM-dependent methyltransferase